MYKLISPLFIEIPRKTKKDRKVYINLNTYRNLHYIVNNQAKQIYKEQMQEQINKLPRFDKINVYFKLYKNSKRKSDKDNIISITKKYFFDALVELGKIEDDNDNFIKSEITMPTELDAGNGRVEIFIETTKIYK